jgi:outer membrane lipoprotein SlyB
LILTVGGLALGALTGAAIGHQIDNQINQASYQILTVSLRNGNQVTVVTDPSLFGRRYNSGDTVMVATDSMGLWKIK